MFWAIVSGLFRFGGASWAREKAETENPLTTISYEGCLGFKIGDPKNFVKSRIEHLKIGDVEETDEVSQYFRKNSPIITAATGKFNSIECITFHFNPGGALGSILITLKAEQHEEESIWLILGSELKLRLGEPINTTEQYVLWKRGNSIVHLERDEGFYLCISNSTPQTSY